MTDSNPDTADPSSNPPRLRWRPGPRLGLRPLRLFAPDECGPLRPPAPPCPRELLDDPLPLLPPLPVPPRRPPPVPDDMAVLAEMYQSISRGTFEAMRSVSHYLSTHKGDLQERQQHDNVPEPELQETSHDICRCGNQSCTRDTSHQLETTNENAAQHA
jgi:hypothetical protein